MTPEIVWEYLKIWWIIGYPISLIVVVAASDKKNRVGGMLIVAAIIAVIWPVALYKILKT